MITTRADTSDALFAQSVSRDGPDESGGSPAIGARQSVSPSSAPSPSTVIAVGEEAIARLEAATNFPV